MIPHKQLTERGYKVVPPSAMRLYVLICQAADSGRPMPSYREFLPALGWKSPTAVMKTVQLLEAAGLVSFVQGSARTIRPLYRLELFDDPISKDVTP